MAERSFESFVKEYNEYAKKNSLPDFETLQLDFDVEKIFEKEQGIMIRDIRRILAEKIIGYSHFFENLINPGGQPIFVFSFMKNISESDKKEIKDIYKELARIQIKAVKLDTVYDEKQEVKFIKETYDSWQNIKKRVYSLVETFEKEFEKNSSNKEGSYFG